MQPECGSGDDQNDSGKPHGQVVQLMPLPTVGFDGVANIFVEELSEIALQLAALTQKQGPSEVQKKRYVEILEAIISRMEHIDEHVSILVEHAQRILNAMDQSERALFENWTRRSTYTVMSVVQKRDQTLHIQRLAFHRRQVIPTLSQDNARVEQFHNGNLARGDAVDQMEPSKRVRRTAARRSAKP